MKIKSDSSAIQFSARIEKIGVNPYVFLPANVLDEILKQAQKSKGPIQVKGKLNGHSFIQTLVKYAGFWRLYLNTPMRKNAGIDVGDMGHFELAFDPTDRMPDIHPKLQEALNKNKPAKAKFDTLPPSRRKEIIRYINHLKSEEAIDKNVKRAIGFLLEKERFIGRDKP